MNKRNHSKLISEVVMNNLIERAKNHETAEQAHEILDEVIDALMDNKISSKESKEVNSAVNKRRKELIKKLRKSGDSGRYFGL